MSITVPRKRIAITPPIRSLSTGLKTKIPICCLSPPKDQLPRSSRRNRFRQHRGKICKG